MSGPCLCGDPYCPSCGNPAAEAYNEAFEDFTEKILALNIRPGAFATILELLGLLNRLMNEAEADERLEVTSGMREAYDAGHCPFAERKCPIHLSYEEIMGRSNGKC